MYCVFRSEGATAGVMSSSRESAVRPRATVRLGRRPALPLAGPGHELGRRNSGRPTGSLRHGESLPLRNTVLQELVTSPGEATGEGRMVDAGQ